MKARFEEIYREQKDTVYGYLYYMSRDEQTAEDLSQETFLKVYRNMGKFRDQCSLKTWCLTIARNTFLSHMRKKQPVLLKEEDWELLPSPGESPEQACLRNEVRSSILGILHRFSETERTILLLRDYEALSYREIGEIMGLSEVVVKGRIFRARNRFREWYAGEDSANKGSV